MKSNSKRLINCAFIIAVVCCATMPMSAQVTGGLQKVNSFLDMVLSILRGASIGVVTVAIMWAGYELLFAHAQVGKIIKILGGGLLIGGAAEIARYIMS